MIAQIRENFNNSQLTETHELIIDECGYIELKLLSTNINKYFYEDLYLTDNRFRVMFEHEYTLTYEIYELFMSIFIGVMDENIDNENDSYMTKFFKSKYLDLYYINYDSNVVHLTLKKIHENINYLSFASLDDQEGTRYHIQYEGYITHDFVEEMINIFLSKESKNYNIDVYNELIKNEYYIEFSEKYYHFVIALNLTEFELESKGCYGGIFSWNCPGKNSEKIVYNISSTGYHMWNDQYSIGYYDDEDKDDY